MEEKIFKINKQTKRIELLEPLSTIEYGYINDVLIPEAKKSDMNHDEVFYKMKSLEAGIRHKVQQLIALEAYNDMLNSRKKRKWHPKQLKENQTNQL